MSELDLGRSEPENAGLVQFKDRLGASRMDLKYYRVTLGASPKVFPNSRSPLCQPEAPAP